MHGNDTEAVENSAEKQRKSRFLDAFYKLADTKLEYRVSGAETVIKELVKSSEESDTSNKLQYTIERLIKGLPSTRKCARVGFAATLVEVLRTFPDVSAEQVQGFILKNLPEDTKEDKNHVILGRCLALAALVRSGKAVETAGSVAKEVLELGTRYSHLQLMACDIFKELLNQVNEKKFKKKVWPELQEMLSCGWEDCTPLKLYVLVQAASRFPGMVDGAFLQDNWGCDSILDKANFAHIVQILQKSTVVHPNVHPVCPLILQAVITTKGFKKFWKSLVDEGLLTSRREEQIFLAVQLVKWCLPQLTTPDKVEIVLSLELRKQAIHALSNNWHVLHSISCNLAQFLVEFAKKSEDAQIQVAILGFFVQPPGTILLDHITKMKVIHDLLITAKPECVQWYAEFLKDIARLEDREGPQHLLKPQREAFEQLSNLLHLPTMAADMDFRAGIVHFLLDAYTARVISKNSSQGEAVRKLFQSAVLKSIVPLKKTKLTEFVDFLSALLLRIKASLGDGASTDIKKCLKKTKHTLERLDSAAGLDEPVSTAFKVLLLYLTILTALGISDDPSSLQEVCSSVRDLLSDTSEAEEGAEEGHKAKWVQLVVDLALSMLSMQSLHVRAIATAAFALLHNQLSDESLALLLDVFSPKKSGDEKQEEDSDADDEMDDGAEDGVESESEESDEDSEMEGEEDCNPDEELRSRLRAALGNAAADDEDSSAEEVVPTDEQMFELDGAIAEAFRGRLRPANKEKSKERTVGIHFQTRCLNLLNGYVKSGVAPLHHLVRIAETLVKASSSSALRGSHETLNVISDTLHIISGTRKFGAILDVRSDVESLTSTVMEQVTLVSHVGMKNSLSALCAFLVRCHKKICSELAVKKVDKLWYMPLYMKTLDSYLDENSHISPQLFVKLMEAFPEHCDDFIEHLVPRATDCAERNYKRLHILGLLVAALRIVQVDASSKEKLTPALEALSELSIKLLTEMAEKSDPKQHLLVELCDLLLLVAKQCANIGMECPIRGNTGLEQSLTSLRSTKMGKRKPLKMKLSALLKGVQTSSGNTSAKSAKSEKRKSTGLNGNATPKKRTRKS
ncbi:myb-binding protein 1A-like protein isoform X2 [Dermacentor silvarum]|uniref:myb-binding protein 1A-like protein isoform X2 n=1 Tax=Dermacentor silvarum TaxID=543639 RepID=UPI002100DBC2|nr:myb-binding protein 1A-like protein isoform X2 [Dermacentor silvarum]